MIYKTRTTKLLCRSVSHCNTLQHIATHCNTLQHVATHCNTLQHTATHCNTLQHVATRCNTLQHTATHRKVRATRLLHHSVSHTATHCQTLQRTATHCNTLRRKGDETASPRGISLTHRNTLQHTVTHCNTLQHGATHIKAHALHLKYISDVWQFPLKMLHTRSPPNWENQFFSSVRIPIESNISIWIVHRNIEKSKFLYLLDFGDVAFAVETVISRRTHSSEILWISRFGGFGGCCTFSGNCYIKTHAHCVKYYFRSLHHTATYYNTLKHTATNCTLLQQTAVWVLHVQAEFNL